jgi:hypothetical protein
MVTAIDPQTMFDLTGRKEPKPLVAEVRNELRAARAAV